MAKSSKGSSLPPQTPKKRKNFNKDTAVITEDDGEDVPLTPFKTKKKQQKTKASKDASYQATNQKDIEDKSTPPPASTTNQDAPLKIGIPSPPPTSSGAIQNKGSSTGVHQLEAGDVQVEHETSSPDEDALTEFKQLSKKVMEENEESESTPNSSHRKRAQFLEDFIEDEEHYSDEVETYFHDVEEMEKREQEPEGTQPTHPDATDAPQFTQSQVRPAPSQIPTTPTTKEGKIALKKSDPLKYVK
ncbi:uncharacterized protein LOC131659291 [Vicia villosa]|uniref:uncharacterized protein LOC131659291 n=1 Tax=Vicia villosa TaxID=3911 RepID=UPI00273B346E|nr:uncharacterized protein LOC131659291 [Vicia villosa]